MRLPRLLPLLVALGLTVPAACGPTRPDSSRGDDDGGDDDGDDDSWSPDDDATSGDDDDATSGDDDSTPAAGAPVVLDFSTDATSIVEGQSVVFTAVVTDPDGIDDLIGGTLLAPSGGTYGAFVTAAQEGAYSLAVAWSQMDTVASIEFATEEDREFVARFYDQGGHTAEASVFVRLHCAGDAACAGECTDLDEDDRNCGACGRVCAGCSAGRCYDFECANPSPAIRTCDDACFDLGKVCGERECADYTGLAYWESLSCMGSGEWIDHCEQDLHWDKASLADSASCCCGG
ncbi:hypothetical protein L6R50_24975 [Myxococcota bacterium]|nr:hypothetical protein [Myxococcota bacterium]